MTEIFIGERELVGLLDMTQAQLTAARRAERFPPPDAMFRGTPLWWRDNIDTLMERIDKTKRLIREFGE
jgi:hypothetical protein